VSGHIITETATFDPTVTVPDNGDAELAESVCGPGVGFQPIANRTQFLNATKTSFTDLNGAWIGERPVLYWRQGFTNDLIIGGRPALILDGKLFPAADTQVFTVTGGGANNWLYLYAFDNSGTLGFFKSTTPPDASLTFQNGGVTSRYIGALRTDNSGNVVPFRMARGHYVYESSALPAETGTGDDYLQSLSNSGNTAAQTLFLKDAGLHEFLLPPHATLADLRVALFNSTPAQAIAGIASYNDATVTTSNAWRVISPSDGDRVFESRTVIAPSQIVQWRTNSNFDSLSIWVTGWHE